ncbi:TPR-like protein [Gonapodya prolifera JEL478]|uniref:TPR-like protein n=1 Tax=Gonapodya prolifera (strain JEL478) TaxID=1344416 RepID=A0A139AFN9_GONPJ|nr:TPR-like protein [Gonapodya prolifera JEL478]|eukprot:KXS15607.1 TPR-like protein [Gonapodya prolifera JEL478]
MPSTSHLASNASLLGSQRFPSGAIPASPPRFTDDEDDIYSFAPTARDAFDRTAFRTSAGRTAGGVPMTARLPTSYAGGARPVTSNRAAGYTSKTRPGQNGLAAFALASTARETSNSTVLPLDGFGAEMTPEDLIRVAEKGVSALLDESVSMAADGDLRGALEKCKEASRRERAAAKQRERAGIAEPNLDLTYCVQLTLAGHYQALGMYPEALQAYTVIVRNKAFNQSGRLRVNMGNCYFDQQDYPQAIKMYRMALDQIPNVNKTVRVKIVRNIGNAFVKLGQYADALTSFETVMDQGPDTQSAFNLLLCCFALGDRDRMRKAFTQLVSVPPPQVEPEDVQLEQRAAGAAEGDGGVGEDLLGTYAREKRTSLTRLIVLAARLIAPHVGSTFAEGFDWCCEAIRGSLHGSLEGELVIAKAVQYMKAREFGKAVSCLKSLARSDLPLACAAATDLAFVHILEGDLREAERCAELAVEKDAYSARAANNAGVVAFLKGDLTMAKSAYNRALSCDSVCIEALFNMGLALKSSGEMDQAVQCFLKLHGMVRNSPEVIWHVADCYEKLGNAASALEWYNVLISVSPSDPSALSSLGRLHEQRGDLVQAMHYFSESHRYHPSDPDVASWLGARYVEQGAFERAEGCFRRVGAARPDDAKWALAIAGCRRMGGNLGAAREAYDAVAERWPDNTECLRFLVRICTDMGLVKDAQQYSERLARLESSGTVGAGDQQTVQGSGLGTGFNVSNTGRRASVAKSSTPIERAASPARRGSVSFAAATAEVDDTLHVVDDLLPV